MSTKSRVLTLLMNHAPEYLSGETMAEQLEVSRTAIWKAINELKKAGHQIDSQQNKGYCYHETDQLSAEGIRLAWPEATCPLTVRVLTHSESTMKDAKLAAIQGESMPALIVAEEQTRAVGRFGRPFFTEKGGGIYMSLILQPQQSFSEIAQYTLIAAVAAAKAMEDLAHLDIKIKWVNDLYLNGKKVAGILSEALTDLESRQISTVIIGMGINFSFQSETLPIDLKEKATALFLDQTPSITRNQLIAQIWANFYTLLAELPERTFLETYREKSFVLGRQVTFTQNQVTYTGIAAAITDLGELVVALANGEQKILSSGEISLSQIALE